MEIARPLTHAALQYSEWSLCHSRRLVTLPKSEIVLLPLLLKTPAQTGGSFSNQSLLPLRPPFLLVESVGIGVTSSILPILRPFLARALMALCAPGPGVLTPTPPLPLNLMWIALIPTTWRALQTSTEASIAKQETELMLMLKPR
jgi:hypothetical protein